MRDPDSILLIEDERLVVETLKGNFQDNGYHITTAPNGEEGLREFRNNSFDLVITDLKLRGMMDGLQVSRKIKKINPRIPVIVVTGYPKLLTSDEASRFGVHDFMLKPFTWAEMLKKVTDCLDTPELTTFSPQSKASDSLIVARKKATDRPASRLERREPKSRKDPYQSLSQFLSGQTRALEMLIQGEPLKEILNALILEMELCSDQISGSIHMLDSEKAQLDCIVAPHLPAPLLQDIGSVSLGGWVNPWSTAITHNKPILIEDISKSPLWERCHASAKTCGFEASWSFPLRNSDQQAMGVLTFYNRESRSPSSTELKWVLSATRLLSILMEYQNLKNTRSQTESQVERLVEQGREAVVTFNDRGVIDSFNTAAAKLFGYSDKTLIGQNIKTLVIGQNPSQNHNAFKRIDDGSEGEPATLKAAAMGLRKDGAKLFLDLSVGELAQQTGRKFVATIVDVSKLNYAEKILNETRNKLEELNESGIVPESGESNSLQKQLVQSEKWAATGKLAASLAHEFKNPLFGILNVLERAAREFSLKQGSEDLLELAIRECYRAMALVGKMQDIHRPSSNSVEPMDLNSAITDMVTLTQAGLQKRNIELVLDLDSNLPKVYGIEDQIKQVVLNLLNNAEEAISDAEGKIIVGTRALESSLKIVVKDNGNGIPEDQRQKVFEPFFSTKKDNGGMGLGLAVSYGIIKAHGGRIDVEKGIEGKGTSFVITLPKRPSRKAGRRSDNYLTATPSWN